MDSKLGDLKLRERTEFKLHKLCIYEEGGFFSKHVDTVHDENHYGSAVVCLPTQHEGGELIIRFDSKEKVFDFSKKSSEGKLHAVSFYTDCEHEVKPVTKGTRVVLQYDLLEWCSDSFDDYIDSTEIGVPGLSEYSRLSANTAVIDQLVEQFNNFENLVRELVGNSRYYSDLKYPLTPAIFLFHRYTFKGFDESKLKGIDRHLFDSLSQHFKLSLCPVVVDYYDYHADNSLIITANIFDYDLVFGYKKDHPLLEKDITIIFNPISSLLVFSHK